MTDICSVPSDEFFKINAIMLFVIGLGFVVDFALYVALIRLAGAPEAVSIFISLLSAAALNFLILDWRLNKRSIQDLRKQAFLTYLVSIVLIYFVRLGVVYISGDRFFTAEIVYFFAMCVSFVVNWIVLKLLFPADHANKSTHEQDV